MVFIYFILIKNMLFRHLFIYLVINSLQSIQVGISDRFNEINNQINKGKIQFVLTLVFDFCLNIEFFFDILIACVVISKSYNHIQECFSIYSIK